MGAQAFVPPSLARTESRPRAQRTRAAEAFALLLFAGAAFLTLALLSYRVHPHNPTYHGADWMGAVGAALGGLLVSGFGAAAWWVPLELLLLGAPLFRGGKPELVGLRIAGDLVILILLASLLQVAAPDWLVFGFALPGGQVGLFFGELMRGLFSAPGSFLVGLTGIGLILIGRSSFSFIEWCERALALQRQAIAWLRDVGRQLVGIWMRASDLRREEAERASLRSSDVGREDESAELQRRLEAAVPWVPNESTGAPPLAVAESLHRALSTLPAWEQEWDTPLHADAELDGFWQGISQEGDSDEVALERSFSPPLQEASGSSRTTGEQAGAPEVEDDDAADWTHFATALDEVEAGPQTVAKAGNAESKAALDEVEAAPAVEAEADDEEGALVESVGDELAPAGAERGTLEPAQALLSSTKMGSAVAEPRIIDTTQARATRAARPEKKPRHLSGFELPDTELLYPPADDEPTLDREVILENAELLEKTLADYGVTAKVEEIHPGPTVTTYEVAPAAGTKVSKVANLSDDLALGLSRKVRIIAPIPGKSRIGFEIPNDERVPVNLRELVEDERFQKLAKKSPLPVVLGRDIVGAPYYADLSSMPHVIVAGATGAGKSVGLNVMLSSLLFKRSPEELRLLMIDPKVVELAPFDKIPHLLLPVVTDMNHASQALKWAVDEMERRYQLFADAGTKNITTYNRYVQRVRAGEIPPPKVTSVAAVDHNGDLTEVPVAKKGGDGEQLPDSIPYIVIVVDEFADLIMQQGKEVEASVARLAQKARAAGMHVILATQRPSVDVITGMIKANFPSRIAYRVAQKVDSRTILDEMGAEVLLGRGDMLVKLNGATDTSRVQCPFVSEEEVNDLCDFLRAQGDPEYEEGILQSEEGDAGGEEDEPMDARFEEAVLIVRDSQRCSTSWLQRKMTIGYNRAAKMVDMMERRGFVGPPNGSKDREVMLPP